MQILSGLYPHMVLQRNHQDVCDTTIAGTCGREGKVLVTVAKDNEPLTDFFAEPVGTADGQNFQAVLRGVPVGGPYTIQLTIASATGKWIDTVKVEDVLVGDVWLLAGQSNMQGVGLLADRPAPHPLVRAEYMDHRWGIAEESLHNIHEAADEVHRIIRGGTLPAPMTLTGVGPGHAFALEMYRRRGVPQGVIAAAHGGTSMAQWDPKLRDEGGRSLYGAMIARLRRNGGRTAGMIWYQGESDANAAAAPQYTARMVELIECLRRDTQAPELPVAIVQISRVVGWDHAAAVHWNRIQEEERRLPGAIDHLAVVPAIDLSLDDGIHISGRGQHILGRRLAEAIETLAGRPGALPPPIALRDLQVVRSERLNAEIHVAFDHVVGELTAAGRPWGFQLVDGHPVDRIIDIRLKGDTAVITTSLSPFETRNARLHYGYGTNPLCNIGDQAGRSLPVFGPLPIGEPRAMTPAIRRILTSPLLPGAGDLTGLQAPASWKSLHLQARDFDTDFCNRHAELAGVGEEDALVWYAGTLVCDEPMAVTVLLGYDGPVKAWLDGREVHHDPRGTNPAVPDKASIDIDLASGKHPLLIALGANRGLAWGIFLRLVRRDVTRQQLDAGSFVLPRFEV